MDQALFALADPTRMALCRRLAERELSVRQLSVALGISQPLVSHHLKVLRAAGLVRSRRASYWTFYGLDPDVLAGVGIELVNLAEKGGRARAEAVARTLRALAPARRAWGRDQTPGEHLEEGLDGALDELASEHVGVFSRPTIERFLVDSLRHFAAGGDDPLARAVAHTRQRLAAVARSSGRGSGAPEVLFVCVRNAGRSQLAVAMLRRRVSDEVRVRSAGSQPAERIDPNVEKVLSEVGLDLSSEFPKPLTDEFVRAADVVVTMGCGDACPVYEGKTYFDWDLPDPTELALDDVRTLRDTIAVKVDELVRELDLPERRASRRLPQRAGS